MAVAATGAEISVLCGQGGGFDSVDGVCVGILARDGGAALALADQRALDGGQVSINSGSVQDSNGQESRSAVQCKAEMRRERAQTDSVGGERQTMGLTVASGS